MTSQYIAVSSSTVLTELSTSAQEGADWGITIGSSTIAIFLFVGFMVTLFNYFRN
jgi:hypothetical protein